MNNRKVIYTAVFGEKDTVLDPLVVSPGFDYVCFTDNFFHSNVWDVRVVTPPVPNSARRSSRWFKILPHICLPEYDVSVYVDGNLLIRSDLNPLVDEYLTDVCSVALYDHSATGTDAISSLDEEVERHLEKYAHGRFNDDPDIIKKQFLCYQGRGFDADKHYITMVIVRRHHEPKVKVAMQMWWAEYSKWSQRDQMSFAYVWWAQQLSISTIKGNARSNEFFEHQPHLRPPETVSGLRPLLLRAQLYLKKLCRK